MASRVVLLLLCCSALFLPVACSGGSSSTSAVQSSCNAVNGQVPAGTFCLVSCNLGCTAAGCAINQIAQNQPLFFTFNQDIDAATVSTASFSLRTATGEEPVGRFLVNGSVVSFVPEVLVVGGASFFGFRAGETYMLDLLGGPNEINAVRSTSGSVLTQTYSCSLAVTLGIQDLNQAPPTPTLVSPTVANAVPPQTTVVVEFDEFIAHRPFLSATPATQPITVAARPVRTGASGLPECDPSKQPTPVFGTWDVSDDPVRQVSRATFRPQAEIPGGVCIEVTVTAQVEDLAGNSAAPTVFTYVTEASSRPPEAVEEAFGSNINLDLDRSSGAWQNGAASPGVVGWDGLHGDFDYSQGNQTSPGVYEWNADNTLIKKAIETTTGGRTGITLSGKDERITDGVFRFATFVVPPGITVRFVGNHAVRIYVRGKLQVDGTLDLSGGSLAVWDGATSTGQPGAVGGSGGGAAASGAGGRGADAGDGAGHQARFDGAPGEDVHVLAGHAYAAQAPGTKGNGSAQFPADGLNSSVNLAQIGPAGFPVFCGQIAAGGGGGGLANAGENGTVVQLPTGGQPGPDAAGGHAFASLWPVPAGKTLFDHFAVGGAGGGGSGTHPFLSSAQPGGLHWRSGGGGAAGGGALGLSVGGDCLLNGMAQITARGGSTAGSATNNWSVPGGAGSGGSVVFRVGQIFQQGGIIDVRGGVGGSTVGLMGSVPMESKGGDGSDGWLRVEVTASNPAMSLLGSTLPAASAAPNVGISTIGQPDSVVGSTSVWRFTQQLFAPRFLRYEVEATVDGRPVTFSDDPSVGSLAGGSAPVQFYAQGAGLTPAGQVDPLKIGLWRRYVGPFAPAANLSVNDDQALAVRFVILFDLSTTTKIKVNKVRIVYQPF